MDAYYYTVGGQQLAMGRGFTEPFIWNYLDDPTGLPRPSHQYWMPLPSILAALAMRVGGTSFRAAQVPFMLLSALLAVIAYGVAWQTSASRRHAWAAAMLAIFSGFYMAYWSVPETFAPFAVFGSLSLWALSRAQDGRWGFIVGACAGLAHLTRADGVLLLLPALFIRPNKSWRGAVWAALGYAVVMSPWLAHNWTTTGRLLSIAGAKSLFLTNYDDLYSLGKTLDLSAYLSWGLGNILGSKLDAVWANLQTLVAAVGMILLAPLAVIGFWRQRHAPLYQGVIIYGAGLYLAMSLAFTFPGARGGMFHSGAALLPFVFATALVGLDAVVDWAAARISTWEATKARRGFTWELVGLAVLLSVALYGLRVRGWNQADAVYASIGARLRVLPQRGQQATVVVVNNPPGYVYHTGQWAIAIPNGDVDTLLVAARRYGAAWVVLEANHPAALSRLYNQPRADPRLILVETVPVQGSTPAYLFRLEDEQ
jgi:4-amino-4-deoxy-L-arabinose transferase-like glycosyltransferase